MDAPTAIEPGVLLSGRFRLGPRLDRDWRGDLFQAADEREGGRVCEVELVRSSGKLEEQLHRLVEREVDIGQMWLKDVPDVLRALAWGLLGPGEVFVARELLPEGKPLETSGPDLDAKVWQILSAANLVAELHRRGIAHRDLGPRALVQGAEGQLRLARFALARLDEVAEPWAGPLGLPLLHLRSAAPEILLRPGEAGARADVYSLGTLLFRAAVGRWPYAGPSLAQLIAQQLTVQHRAGLAPTDGVNLPPGLRKVIARALALDPAERFADAGELSDALETWLSVGGGAAEGDDSDLGALDLTAGDAPAEPVAGASAAAGADPLATDLVAIETCEDPDGALEHSALEGSQEEWILPPDIVPPPLPELPPLAPLPAAAPLPAPRTPTPGAQPRPAVVVAEPVPAPEPPTDPATLAPVEDVCPGCEVVGEGVLLIPGSPRELDGRVRGLRHANLSALRGLLIDLRWITQLGGAELEALAALQSLARRRGLRAGMLGANKAVRHILQLMDLGGQVPLLLANADPEEGASELLDGDGA